MGMVGLVQQNEFPCLLPTHLSRLRLHCLRLHASPATLMYTLRACAIHACTAPFAPCLWTAVLSILVLQAPIVVPSDPSSAALVPVVNMDMSVVVGTGSLRAQTQLNSVW